MDTIFALATAQGRAGVAVVRISGSEAHRLSETLCGTLPDPRRAALRRLTARNGLPLDDALVLRFDGPASFTGEDTVEFHLHGSIAVVQAVLGELGQVARMAEPGEFTRRALENERLDLAQVEGLADLIDAETEAQRRQALRVLSGALGERVEGWRAKLIRAAALLEATIDFADEDVPVDVTPEVTSLLQEVEADLSREISGTFAAERIRNGFEVAIVGAPNVGKSTLLNRLAGRDAAITSEVAGTTRDVIEVRMDLGGLPVTILDTAGIRDSEDTVERIGISRAKERAEQADLRIILAEKDSDVPIELQATDILCQPKGDLGQAGRFPISGLTGLGVDALVRMIEEKLRDRVQNAGIATRARHRNAMEDAATGLGQVEAILLSGPDQYDIATEELRNTIRSLEVLVGRVDVENLLDEIFASFCLGK